MLKKEGRLMTGLLYKEFRQNRFMLLIGIGISLFFLMLPIQAVIEEYGGDEEYFNAYMMTIKLAFSAAIFFMTGAIHSVIFESDERKKWVYFAACTPECVEGVLWRKYTVVFMLTGICVIYCFVVDAVFCIFAEESSVISIVMMIVYVQIFLRAIEIPFWVRFGTKRGSMVKAAIMLAIIFAIILYALFGDLSVFSSSESLIDKIMGFVNKFLEGDMPDGIILITGVFPFAAAALYYLSYRISCKLYLKGVEEFDK